jgi:hypothetical protein
MMEGWAGFFREVQAHVIHGRAGIIDERRRGLGQIQGAAAADAHHHLGAQALAQLGRSVGLGRLGLAGDVVIDFMLELGRLQTL